MIAACCEKYGGYKTKCVGNCKMFVVRTLGTYSYAVFSRLRDYPSIKLFNPLSAELNSICHLLALLGAHHILHVSRIRVKTMI